MTNDSFKSFVSLIQEIDTEKREQRDRGTLFELLVATYLKNEPAYARLFDNVWMLSDVPEEYHIPEKDTGVDLVAKKQGSDELVAIQCKYYDENTKIRKEHIDSFLNEMGKSYYTEGLIITTAKEWSDNANEAIQNRDKKIMRISLHQLQESRIDWSQFSFSQPEKVTLKERKQPLRHQKPAISNVVKGFNYKDRGKLIMAPGTGKTFTSLAITEEMAKQKQDTMKVLYLVPSIQLLSQTLREWNADTDLGMSTIAVCSDRKVTKSTVGKDAEDIAATDIGFPPTTNAETLLKTQKQIEQQNKTTECIVVFSTYQSIDVISEAQQEGFYDFDLMICDEAHRTTGATEAGEEESFFTKVHYDHYVKADKRLYQTATPRVYGDNAKQKAEEKSVLIADMNDSNLYGEEFYRIGFGDAIQRGILTDYKVMVLGVDEEIITRRFQNMLANENELQFDDVTKIIGCWNGLVKRKGKTNQTLGPPMKRALAFTSTIKESKKITDMFSTVVDEYLRESRDPDPFSIDIKHADGSMNAVEKNEKIDWLKSEVPDNTCRVLSNARFLTEGIDVPNLDAVMFLQPKKSQIDVAQAVGRVMRKAEGKEFGYIILPIGVPGGSEAHSVLDDNEKYQVVWDILNALRSIDERFDATINTLDLNNKKPNQISIGQYGEAPYDEMEQEDINEQQDLDAELWAEKLSDLEDTIYGKIVKKVGDTRYWEHWSEDVAEIARKHIVRINAMLEDKNSKTYEEFKRFMTSLHHNVNDSITEQQAIEMLSQHLITKPVFEALFDSNSFANNNPVSRSMESILNILDKQGLLKEQEQLRGFYESVRIRAEGIDNLKNKQDIIKQLYENFFKVAFPGTTNRLGIVFTPNEIVDFIIGSVDDILKTHFGISIKDKGVHVLDPFTGTGTFMVRLLQSGIIPKEDLLRKYTQELHANEIVLLSYYIAAVNIEETFHSIYDGEYMPFEGIVLTDTFESIEKESSFEDQLFSENNERLDKQQQNPVFAIIGNPPYSARQTNDNDNNINTFHPIIDEKIKNTYVKYSNVENKNTLYDPLVRAFRWSTDRISDKGVIGFVTNNSYIDSQTASGIRKSFYEDFNYLYIINLRGSIRGRSGEGARREGQNVFDILAGVAICFLVKDGTDNHHIKYFDIGEFLSKQDKIDKLIKFESMNNIEWSTIIPDNNNDWINQRDQKYSEFIPMDDKYNGIFNMKSLGVSTNRDSWVYGFSRISVEKNISRLITNFNYEIERLKNVINKDEKVRLLNSEPSFVSWSSSLKKVFLKGDKLTLNSDALGIHVYRPFTKKWLYYDNNVVERPRKFKKAFGDSNRVILVPGNGSRRNFSCLMVDAIPDLNIFDAGSRGFLLYDKKTISGLFNQSSNNISENIAKKLGLSFNDVFYYTYGVLHSPDYRQRYANDLKKQGPRIPILKNKESYVDIGKKLADLHVNYESVPLSKDIKIKKNNNPSYKIKKMKHPRKDALDKIIFNNDITIENIPEKAYEYVINGKPAIEWIIDQYQVKTNKKTGITDDPNDYSNDEKYIFHLLLSIINVSVQTVNLMNDLPRLEIDE